MEQEMTILENADDLINKFHKLLGSYDDIRLRGKHVEIAKKCALIEIEDMISLLTLLSKNCSQDSQWMIDDKLEQAERIKSQIELH